MEFKDFTPDQLIGKKVLHTWGMPYNRSQEIRIIEKVSPKYFGLSKLGKSSFALSDGYERGDIKSYCRLITDEESKVIESNHKLKFDIQTKQNSLIIEAGKSIKVTDDNLKKLNQIIELVESLEK